MTVEIVPPVDEELWTEAAHGEEAWIRFFTATATTGEKVRVSFDEIAASLDLMVTRIDGTSAVSVTREGLERVRFTSNGIVADFNGATGDGVVELEIEPLVSLRVTALAV